MRLPIADCSLFLTNVPQRLVERCSKHGNRAHGSFLWYWRSFYIKCCHLGRLTLFTTIIQHRKLMRVLSHRLDLYFCCCHCMILERAVCQFQRSLVRIPVPFRRSACSCWHSSRYAPTSCRHRIAIILNVKASFSLCLFVYFFLSYVYSFLFLSSYVYSLFLYFFPFLVRRVRN